VSEILTYKLITACGEERELPEPSSLASSECEAIRPVELSSSTALPINKTEEEAPAERFAERIGREHERLELPAIQIKEMPDEEDIVKRTGGDQQMMKANLSVRPSGAPCSCHSARCAGRRNRGRGVGEVNLSEYIDTGILPEETVKFDKGKDHAILSSPEPPSTTEMKGVFEAPFDVPLE
ncbi:hypothetical protein DXG01_007230, partial [Tephrocybe rancida]